MQIKLSKDQYGNEVLTVTAPLTDHKQSRSGNSTLVATSRGNQYIGLVRGKPTYLQLNVMQMEGGAAEGINLEVEGGEQQEQEGARPIRRKAA